ncbi:MAG: 50S ribosomal protein L25 [Ilumatobacteraceae bacterium]
MSDTVLVARSGRQTGSPESRRLRRTDVIPAVVYGLGMEPISVSVDRRDLRLALSGPAGMNTVLDLQVDGASYPAIVKEMQRHPVKRTVSHIDFMQVNLDVEITVGVPVRLEGEAKEVALHNGLVDQQMTEIQVRTTPRIIPDEFVIDISSMTVETVITVGDVAMPTGVTAVSDADQPVVTVTILRTAAAQVADEAGEAEAAEESSGEESSADSAE